MGMRYRSVTKIGKGQYVTSNYSFGTYILYLFFYWIFAFPIYAFFKYLIYVPIKFGINKTIELINSKK